MKRITSAARKQLAAAMAVLYGAATEQTKAEAEQLARVHCARVERGVPRNGSLERSGVDLFDAPADATSGRCRGEETTPAAEAVRTTLSGATGRGGHPHGDSATYFRVA